MGILDDLAATLRQANDSLNRSLYDPPRLEVDGIVHETDIPGVEGNPAEGGYPHNDFARDPGVEAHIIDSNDVIVGAEFEGDKEDWRNLPVGSPENPDFSTDAPANVMTTGQLAVPLNGTKILNPNLRRLSLLIQNNSTTANVYISGTAAGASAASGITVGPGQSIDMQYCGELFASASAVGTVIGIAEFYRNVV